MVSYFFLVWIVVGIAGAFCVFWIVSRCVQLWWRHDKKTIVQKAELQKNILRTSDQFDLPYTKHEPKEKTKKIYLCVHDLYGNENDFQAFCNANPQAFIITYSQRGIREQFKPFCSIATHADDLYSFVQAVHEQYGNYEIILVCEGFAANLYAYYYQRYASLVKEVYLVNLISHQKRVKLGFIGKFYFLVGFLVGFNRLIRVSVNYEKLIKNKHARELIIPEQKLLALPLRQIYQYNKANKKILPKIMHSVQKVPHVELTVVQSVNDIFYNSQTYAKIKVNKHLNNLNWMEVKHEAHLNMKWHLPERKNDDKTS